MWRTTPSPRKRGRCRQISIHVPRVEDDAQWKVTVHPQLLFQSTSPVWRTTMTDTKKIDEIAISIHVPRVEDDRHHIRRGNGGNHFNPRPPCGGRPSHPEYMSVAFSISIHVPRVEDDCVPYLMQYASLRFQSTSPVWRTTILMFTY